ncbi:autotransporter domain-containing protein [Ancylobacter lacus]|nr:autotransporter domain-containing protein [Ancylobacter lacus]
MTASGAHDLVAAGGSATIENGAVLDVVAAPGLYHAGMAPVTVLTAAGGITGSFTTVLTNLAFLAPDMSYGTDAVTFTLERNGVAFADEANTANERAVAAAVESLGPGNSLYDAIVSQESGASAPAFNALSGEIYASTSTVIQQQSTYVRDAVGERLRQAFAPAGTGEPADGPATAALGPNLAPIMWMQGFGGWGDTSGNGNAASVSNSIGGAIGGIDAAVAEGWRLGVYGGYSYSTFDVDGRDSQGTMNSYDLGVYAGTRAGAFTARFGGGYAWHDVDVSRTIAFDGYSASAHSDATVGSGQLFAEAGYDIALTALGAPPATKGVLQPFVGLAYVHVDGATFAEGSGAAELSTREEDMSTTYSTLGVRLSGTVEIGGRELRPELTLGWQHAFGDITPQATAQFTGSNVGFTVSGVPVAEDAALVGVGLAYAISPLADISLRYTGQLASDAQQSNVAARLSIRF